MAVAVTLVVVTARSHQPTPIALPLRTTGELALPGNSSRFDYASLDTGRGLLFIAHLGASEIIEVDIHAHHVVRTILNLPRVHGVLVVPALHRVYATATGTNLMVSLDEDTGAVPTRTPSGEYPDGLAYDPRRAAIWTTNETSGSETVIDAVTGAVRGTVALGAEAGNVAYDPNSDQMLVAVQGHNQLAIIDPATLTVTARVPLPGCQHSHGLALDPGNRLAFLACDGNATLLTVDLTTRKITGTNTVGEDPDVLGYDQNAHRLYVAAESGLLSVLDLHDRHLSVTGSDHLADGAHVVTLDPGHPSQLPDPHQRGRPPSATGARTSPIGVAVHLAEYPPS
ncbi:MAG TPA: YncE family protein [Pseudonocardiaceae bacterium]|nr:YncE family protein [Pseudonocardiaceae bacterium]